MKLKLIFGFLLFVLIFSCSPGRKKINSFSDNDKIEVRSDFKKYFDDCNAQGSIAIYDNNSQKWILSDTTTTKKKRFLHRLLRSLTCLLP